MAVSLNVVLGLLGVFGLFGLFGSLFEGRRNKNKRQKRAKVKHSQKRAFLKKDRELPGE